MTTPRIEINLSSIRSNTEQLVGWLAPSGISVTGITKAMLGSPAVARAMLVGGATAIGDSRIENIERMVDAGIEAPTFLVRSPMRSQAERVVASGTTSLISDADVIDHLSAVSRDQATTHSVVLMVELGDLREGVLPADAVAVAVAIERCTNVALVGVGANLACRYGVVPDQRNMDELSRVVDAVDLELGTRLPIVSGGNSATLTWLLAGGDPGRTNTLRIGESLLLGTDPLYRRPIPGLKTDAVRVVGEVIESRCKPRTPWGTFAESAFGTRSIPDFDGSSLQSLIALGEQDVDPEGVSPPEGICVVGASSDHLVVESDAPVPVGSEIAFGLSYGVLVRAMTSPFVAKAYLDAVSAEFHDGV